MAAGKDLVCYVYPGWRPRIRAAAPRRAWMDASPESFAYRCLPLGIANAHGWEILSPCGFEAVWNGGPAPSDVTIRTDPGTAAHDAPVPLFGVGTLTLHIPGLFRTPPGTDLWIGGPPNCAKDGIAPLSGVVETDWAPYTFTMNWRFTRPHQPVRFEQNEPVCFLFPLPRDLLHGVAPRIAPIDEAPELKRRFEHWSQGRARFQAEVAAHPPASPGAKWQKFYFRGTDADGAPGPDDHRSKLRLPEFAGSAAFLAPAAAVARPACPHAPAQAPDPAAPSAEQLLSALDRLRALSPRYRDIPIRRAIGAEDFLDLHYAANWPLLLAGELEDWPPPSRWTPDALAALAGAQRLDAVPGAPATLADFLAGPRRPDGAGGPARLRVDPAAVPALAAALPGSTRLLGGHDRGQLWFELAGSGVAPAQARVNLLLLQAGGQRRIWLAPPGESAKLRAAMAHGPLGDLTAPDLALRAPSLRGLRLHAVQLGAGDALFVPSGWWLQSAATTFSASLERTDFRWPNPA